MATHRVSNFGANVCFQPATIIHPTTEDEILQALDHHRDQSIRVVGALHSWSPLVETDGVLLDLSQMATISVNHDGTVTVGAACRIETLISALNEQGLTLPSLGLIQQQAIAGATATGTHGSGKNSLSHYVERVRIAHYDSSGRAVVSEIVEGDAIRAARCSLGTLGVITEVTLTTRPQYNVEEHFESYATIAEALHAVDDFPVQQIFLVPWKWDFFAQLRVESTSPRSRLAWLYRLYWWLPMDRLLHMSIYILVRWLPWSCTRFFWKRLVPITVPLRWKVVDRSDHQLTMEHHLFRHIEIEEFVPESRVEDAVNFVRQFIEYCAGLGEFSDDLQAQLKEADLWNSMADIRGCYHHHYVICIRKILPDDTMLSPTASDDQPRHAFSFISYAPPHRRDGFFQFADVLSQAMAALFDARPHWGKHCPLPADKVISLYPEFSQFNAVRMQYDPQGRFLNGWLENLFQATMT